MMFDGCVVADAVAPASTSAEPAGSDVSATSALPSSCMDGRSRRCVTVIPESNAFRSASGMDARHGDDPHRAGGCGGAVVLCRPKRSVSGCLEGQLSGIFPGQLLPRGPRPSSSTRAVTSCVTRCMAAATGSNSMTLVPLLGTLTAADSTAWLALSPLAPTQPPVPIPSLSPR
jgi:hypothetical protein